MKILAFLLTIVCSLSFFSCGDEEIVLELEPIQFADTQLEQCIRQAMGLNVEELRPIEAATLTSLECTDRQIQSLVGLEHFVNLKDLALWENNITQIHPLSTLTQLTYLQLGGNKIASLTPLSGLTQLRRLGLYGNQINSIGAIGVLNNLEWVDLANNNITDIVMLTQLKKLRWATVADNPIQNHRFIRALRTSGVDVYDGSEAPTSKSSISFPENVPPGPNSSEMSVINPTLSWRIKKGEEVQLQCVLENETRRAHHEFGGIITLNDGQFEYTLNGITTVIGRHNYETSTFTLCSGEYANTCEINLGVKRGSLRDLLPGFQGEPHPICSATLSIKVNSLFFSAPKAYPDPIQDKHLMPYVFASPNQLDAGTCLFMSNTGAMEILLNQHIPRYQWEYEGDTDLSERYLINASTHVPRREMPYSITDVIRTYNHFQGSLLNRDYPFTMASTENGLSCSVNWEDELPDGWQSNLTTTPPADRTILFIDPNLTSQSIWNVGIIKDDVVERIKYELRSKNSPVIVIYNHYLYWHADIVVGYDDTASIGECPMVRESVAYFKQQGHTGAAEKIEEHLRSEGGCLTQGIFYVRDSIYEGTSEEPAYNYGGVYNNERYSKRIVERTYDWVKYLSNHAYTVHRQ